MGIQLTKKEIKEVIKRVILNQNHRLVIESKITDIFFKEFTDFINKSNKLKKNYKKDWIKKTLKNKNVDGTFKEILGGLANKSIGNMYGSSNQETVSKATSENIGLLEKFFDKKKNLISEISIKFKKEKIVYNSFESMILAKNIGILHGKIRGGAWSALGKNVETSLMITLCNIFSVPSKNYSLKNYDHLSNDTEREVDFYFIDNDKNEYKCEVKLMGKGNPESGDSVFARGTKVFVADKLSNTLKNQLSDNNILFVELHQKKGFMKLYDVLKGLNINCSKFEDDIVQKIDSLIKLN